MSRMNYLTYLSDTFSLARSVVVKFSQIATVQNEWLTSLGHKVDTEKPATWKYYMNLAGQYHPTDKLMYVRSMDTLTDIAFTLENLTLHRATAREYKPGTVYYQNLVQEYPDQADLINGIVNPVDIEKAISSKDGEILYYDANYVEDNEDNFRSELQNWVDIQLLNYFNQQYLLIDDLYLQAFLGNFATSMVNAILNIRWQNCWTRRAHSFHIREFFASNGRLDGYIPYLTKPAQLWLYRNLKFLRHNAGKQDTFDRLVANLLTPRGIPLIKYDLRQNVKNMPANLYADVEMVKLDVNSKIVMPGFDKVSVDSILTREQPLAKDNKLIQDESREEIIDQVKSDKFSRMPTKILDSEVVDRSNSSVRTLFHVLWNHWIYLASSNRYRAFINVANPATGEYMAMSVKDALVVALYCFKKTRGLTVDVIPELVAYEVLRNPLPTFGELASIVPMDFMPEGMVQAIMDRVTPMTDYISTEKFYNDCAQVHKDYLTLWELYSYQEHYRLRGYCEQLVKRHYMYIKCKLVEGDDVHFEDWLEANNYKITDLNNTDLDQLLMDVINIATGSNLVTVVTLGEVQRELLKLMGDLSSYPLQFLRNVSYTDFAVMGIPAIRVGDQWAITGDYKRINTLDFNVRSVRGADYTELLIPSAEVFPNVTHDVTESMSYHINPWVCTVEDMSDAGYYRLNVQDVTIRRMKIEVDYEPVTNGKLDQYQNSDDPEWPNP